MSYRYERDDSEKLREVVRDHLNKYRDLWDIGTAPLIESSVKKGVRRFLYKAVLATAMILLVVDSNQSNLSTLESEPGTPRVTPTPTRTPMPAIIEYREKILNETPVPGPQYRLGKP